MAWDSLTMYQNGLDFFGDVVRSVPADGWDRPSPCAGWTALDVLGHVGGATEVGVAILTDGSMDFGQADPPGAAVEGDPPDWWARLEATARTAASGVDDLDRVVESPMGPRTVRDGLSFPAVDLFVHGWDLAAATGQTVEIPPEAIAFTEAMFAQLPEEMTRQPGVFAAQVPSTPGASPTARLIAFTGRDPAF